MEVVRWMRVLARRLHAARGHQLLDDGHEQVTDATWSGAPAAGVIKTWDFEGEKLLSYTSSYVAVTFRELGA